METFALSRLEKKILSLGIVGKVALTLTFVVLTAISSQVKIFLPFSPVPITMQTFAVILSGIVLKEEGVISQVLYLTLGILGVGVFTNGGGLSYVFSATFGYIVGFIPASYLAGVFTRKFVSSKMLILGLILADLSIYVPGLLWLYVILSRSGSVSLFHILSVGFFPFIIGDILKIFASFGFAKAIKRI
ncbi:biotin transporter BioY [Caldisericum exile]|uniref:Biotin transporter n=1 Tax=Caldisericum exile (strain DSM 21853 / NBRC 104410 / AZM16c01) TaxID=511051 RepID=A0A7U6GCZ1_CALEA|nr:biotin transporter BioY [Caldisericum exile]BAL80132.1 BioY family protein [Caldisericum exile AZM16c01]